MRVSVVKVGGRLLSDPAWLERFSTMTASTDRRLVIVHGGGPEVDALCGVLGIPIERRDGLRVTSAPALDAASMVLTGRLNKRLVRALVDAGVDALGVSGEDGALLVAGQLADSRLGRVGHAVRVRRDLLMDLMRLGIVPVLSPISRGPDGAAVNVNADEAATAVAVALGAEELLLLTDVAGVFDGEAYCTVVTREDASLLVARGVAGGGMAVKLKAASVAIDAGVPVVRIGPAELLVDATAGTRLEARVAAAGRSEAAAG